MTQENKELLLKDLSSRLPYGVNVEYTSKAIVIATNTEEIITRPLKQDDAKSWRMIEKYCLKRKSQ